MDRRDFVAELVKELFDVGNFEHLDGYGGALLAMDLDEAVENLVENGWQITKATGEGTE